MRWISGLDTRRRVAGTIGVVAVVVVTVGIVAATRDGTAGTIAADDAPVASSPATTTFSAPSSSTTLPTRRTTLPTAPVITATPTDGTVASTTTSTTSTTVPLPTIDPASLLPTLREGDTGPEVTLLQQMLVATTGADLIADGIYGPATVEAVRNFQMVFGLPPTGEADHDTRQVLRYVDAGRTSALPTWPVPSLGNGGADGCQVTVIGDSLMAGSEAVHERSLSAIGCASAVDGEGGRSLAYGWQCREQTERGRGPLLMYPEPLPGNETCAPSGLTLLALWANADALGDIVVVALGTNDAGLYSPTTWEQHWTEALRLAGSRPVIFVSTRARPGSNWVEAQNGYSAALRSWCSNQVRCHLADWALTATATDAASYFDHVHLRSTATHARSDFIASATRALFAGDPIPNPRPVDVPTPSLPPATTTPAPTTTTVAATTTTSPTTTNTSTNTSTTTTSIARTTTTTAPTSSPPTTRPSATTSSTTSTTSTTTTSTTAPPTSPAAD